MLLAVEKPSTGRDGKNRTNQRKQTTLPCPVWLAHDSGRAYFLGLENQRMSSKEISDLMRFVDTDVNFVLDMDEMR